MLSFAQNDKLLFSLKKIQKEKNQGCQVNRSVGIDTLGEVYRELLARTINTLLFIAYPFKLV